MDNELKFEYAEQVKNKMQCEFFSELPVLNITCCGLHYQSQSSLPVGVFIICSGLHYKSQSPLPVAVFIACCCLHYLLRSSLPVTIFITCCGLHYLLLSSLPVTVFITCCGLHYLSQSSLPVAVVISIAQILIGIISTTARTDCDFEWIISCYDTTVRLILQAKPKSS